MSIVLVPLASGFEEIEAVSIIDILRRGDIEVIIASLDENLSVKGANGISIISDVNISSVKYSSLDMIILPGGVEGTYKLAKDENVIKILQDLDARGKNIGAICAAPFALNEAGVLKQNYTCYPSFEEHIRLDGYKADEAMVIEDENIMTSRGPATAICFALEIVKKLKGLEMYNALKEGLLADFCS
jgi:4-methyl-5(b-hydroxyethyl)-thiazole monophosphate biosynthesis